jgi:hypothetical protein
MQRGAHRFTSKPPESHSTSGSVSELEKLISLPDCVSFRTFQPKHGYRQPRSSRTSRSHPAFSVILLSAIKKPSRCPSVR